MGTIDPVVGRVPPHGEWAPFFMRSGIPEWDGGFMESILFPLDGSRVVERSSASSFDDWIKVVTMRAQ